MSIISWHNQQTTFHRVKAAKLKIINKTRSSMSTFGLQKREKIVIKISFLFIFIHVNEYLYNFIAIYFGNLLNKIYSFFIGDLNKFRVIEVPFVLLYIYALLLYSEKLDEGHGTSIEYGPFLLFCYVLRMLVLKFRLSIRPSWPWSFIDLLYCYLYFAIE